MAGLQRFGAAANKKLRRTQTRVPAKGKVPPPWIVISPEIASRSTIPSYPISIFTGFFIGALNENRLLSTLPFGDRHGDPQRRVCHRARDAPVARLDHEREILVAGWMMETICQVPSTPEPVC